MECIAVATLIKDLEEGCMSSEAVECINKSLVTKATKELGHYIGKLGSGLTLLKDFLHALQYLVKHNTSCYSHLNQAGLLDLMSVIFEKILGRLTRDGSSDTVQLIVELITETSNVMADLNTIAKSSVVLSLVPYFLDLLEHQLLTFQTRMEVLKSTNMLLEQCPTQTKDKLLQNSDHYMKIMSLVDLIKTIGDYEFQVGIVECLMRLFPRKTREACARKFFTDSNMLQGFLAIKDRDFEVDCRLFLNQVNVNSEDPSKGVYSLPCLSAHIGSKELKKPSDNGYEEFWVDFNIGSERLTLFCEQDSLLSQCTPMDEELWETVALYKTDVQKCTCNEIEDCIQLEIYMKSPICEIYPSQHQDVKDNKIVIQFGLQLEEHISTAVGLTFNFTEKKNKVSTVENSVHISMNQVKQSDSQTRLPTPHLKSPSIRGSQESVSKRRKVSVPCLTMNPGTPRPSTAAATPIVAPAPTPVIGSAAKTVQKTSKQHDEDTDVIPSSNQEVSSNTNPSDDSTRKASVTRDPVSTLVTKAVVKENGFAVPRTPVRKGNKTSKPKVKTPVVTVTPPTKTKEERRLSKKHTKDKGKETESKANEEAVVQCDDEDTIPDSLPLPDINCMDSKQHTNTSKFINKSIDDSGVGMNDTRSTIDNTSLTEEIELKPEKASKKTKNKKIKKHDNVKDLNPIQESEFENSTISEKDNKITQKICQNVETSGKRKNVNENDLIHKKKDLKTDNFGFDQFNNEADIDSIPESFEDVGQPDEACKSAELDKQKELELCEAEREIIDTKSKAKGRKNKKGKKENAKEEVKEQLVKDKTIKSDKTIQSDKTIKSASCKDLEMNPQCEIEITINERNSKDKKKSKKEKKKSFTDVDQSLKELCDLDEKDILNKKSPGIDSVHLSKENTDLTMSEEKRKVESVYTFCDPDEDFSVIEEKNKKNSRKVKLDKEQKKAKMSNDQDKSKFENKQKADDESTTNGNKNTKKKLLNEAKSSKKTNIKDDKTEKKFSRSCHKNKNYQEKNTSDIEDNSSSIDEMSDSKVNQKAEANVHTTSSIDVHDLSQEIDDDVGEIGGFSEDDSQSAVYLTRHNVIDESNIPTRKSRVSFDLPDSISQEVEESFVVDDVNVNDDDDTNIQEETASNSIDDTSDTSSTNVAEQDSSDKKYAKNNSSKSKCKVPTNIKNKENPSSILKNNRSKHKDTPKHVRQPSPVLSSDSDCLVIESDDSYNARRYRLDEKPVSKSEKKRRKSVANKTKNGKFNSSVESSEQKAHFKDEKKDRNKTKKNKKEVTNDNESSVKEETLGSDVDNSESLPSVPYVHQNNESLKADLKKNKSKKRNKDKNMSVSVEESFENMECEDGFASISRCQVNTVKESKNMVFAMSYSKKQTNYKSRCGFNDSTRVKKEPSYDPYDFFSQCDNASMKSENIDRTDISKELNNKQKHNKNKKDRNHNQKQTSTKSNKESKQNNNDQSMFDMEDDEITKPRRSNKNKKKEVKQAPSKEQEDYGFNNDDPINIDSAEDEVKPATTLVQDKKTKKWYRKTVAENNTIEKSSAKQKVNKKSGYSKMTAAEATETPVRLPVDDSPVVDLSCQEGEQMECSDQSTEECGLNNFSQILKDIVRKRDKHSKRSRKGKELCVNQLNESYEPDIENVPTSLNALDASLGEILMTPCMISSLSSTPKVGSSRRKQYQPLNISIIKTPQSCEVDGVDGDGDSEIESTKKESLNRSRRRKNNPSQYKHLSDSDSENEKEKTEKSNKSKKNRESVSMLGDSCSKSVKSEKSWILDRKKTPREKKYKTYKGRDHSRREGYSMYNSQTEDSQTDGEQSQQMEICSLPINLTTPSLTPSVRSGSRSHRGQGDNEDDILTPETPYKTSKRKQNDDENIEMLQTQENYTVSLNVSCIDDEETDIGSYCRSILGNKTPTSAKCTWKNESDDSGDENTSTIQKLYQMDMKTLLGDSGFASGPSSEVRPSRSSLKRKFPIDVKEESTTCSDVESENEMEQSTFVPKKLFRFDPSAMLQTADTPKAMICYSDGTEDNEVDYNFQSGLASFMSSYGADIQKQLKAKRQRFESCIKQTLKNTQKQFGRTLVEQQEYQTNTVDDHQAKMMLELAAMDKDITRLKEAEQKSEEFFKYQVDMMRLNRESQVTRLNNMKTLQLSLMSKTKKVNQYNLNVHKSMKEQLKKEMSNLQQRLLKENQKQDMMNVKRGLQNMF